MAEREVRYEFGSNWKSFVESSLNETRVANAVDSLRRFLQMDSLEGRTFLDIGCGSGLFSLAACLIGAEKVTSFDYDPDSVGTTTAMRDRHGIPEARWSVERNSVLDEVFMHSLPLADVVYSWGVLHHTGDMWKAIDLAAGRVKPGGLFAIAIYNRVDRFPDRSTMWWSIKRFYTSSAAPVRALMEFAYAANHFLTRLISLRDPFKPFINKDGEGRRGMEFWHDMRDWLGGFPYEFATAGEIFEYVHQKHGYQLERLTTVEGNACHETVFRRPLAPSGASTSAS